MIRNRLIILGLMGMASWASAWAETAALPPEYAQSPSGNPLTEDERAALERGEVLVHLAEISGTPVKKATAVALVAAPPEKVFAALTNYDELPRFMPYCKKVEILKKEGERSRVRFELDFPWPVCNRHYVLQLTDRREEVSGTPVLASRWTYEPGSGNINDTYGAWEVLAYDATRAFVRYTVFTDPGGKLPTWARNMATEVAVPKMINRLRKWVTGKTEEASKATTGGP